MWGNETHISDSEKLCGNTFMAYTLKMFWRGKKKEAPNLFRLKPFSEFYLKLELEASNRVVAHVPVQQHSVVLVQRRHLQVEYKRIITWI